MPETALYLVLISFDRLPMVVFYFAHEEVADTRKLKKYVPTRFMASDSYYDKSAADYAVAFIEALSHTKGTWAGKPFELIDWQEQIIRDIFGTLKPNGYRQFNTAYVEIPKKMGKSELAAAVALLLTCGDGEERAEVYGCAADRNQASIVFNVAADMVRMCPALSKRVKILDATKRLIFQPTGSIYQVLSADVGNKHGFNTHGVVFDELHTQPNRKLFDVMTKGSGDARMQPLYFLITTAGDNQNSICWEVHQKALDILDGRKHDPTFYPVIYGAAPEDDWSDPKVWKKANPSLGITVSMDKVKAAFESARQNPAEENSFRQLRLNQWVKQAMSYLKNTKTNEIITRFVSFRKTQEIIRTVQTALDGTEYLTRFGSPTVHYELTLYVDEAGKASLMSAEDSVPLLECSVRQGVFTGRIVELGDFDYQAAGWYKVTATLAAVSEVSKP